MTTTTSPAREAIDQGDDDDYDDYHDDGDGDNDEDMEEVGDEGDSSRQQRRQIWATMANAVKDTPAAIHERENASVGYVAVGTLYQRKDHHKLTAGSEMERCDAKKVCWDVEVDQEQSGGGQGRPRRMIR